MNSKTTLAIDMGGSKFLVGYVDASGKLLCSERHLWSRLDNESVINDVISAVQSLQENYSQYTPIAAGATIPGLADPKNGLWVEASFSGIKNLNIVKILSEKLHIPVYIDNDTRACALAEKVFGICRDDTDFMWITISNGIGGALYLDNKMYYGGFGNAGEIGHMVVVDNGGRLCKCGSVGCLEMHAAGPAVIKNYLELGGRQLIDGEPATAKSIDGLARLGDAVATATYRLEGQYLGKAIAAIANVINPQKVVIGGGVALGYDLFEVSMNETVERLIYNSANKGLTLCKTGLGYHAAILGAAALAFRGEKIL